LSTRDNIGNVPDRQCRFVGATDVVPGPDRVGMAHASGYDAA
jgi:hypothetical protein